MKPTVSTVTNEGTLGANAKAMTVNIMDLTGLMMILTEMYSDAELAVIREYACNALDSNREAGYDGPIEITLPTFTDPFYIIQDFGTGLHPREMEETYFEYLSSTKTGSNDYVGTFGIGSKSALAYTTSFNIDSVKDGRHYEAIVFKGDDGVPKFDIFNEYETDEPNGVKVTIPVNKTNNFAGKARSFFRFWTEGSILIDGEAPARFEGDELRPGLFWAHNLEKSYVVMGNVPYPVKGSEYHRVKFCAVVPIGDVQIVPAREALYYTPNTEKYVDALTEEFKTLILAKAQKDITEAKSYREAYDQKTQWADRVGEEFTNGLKYHGHDFPSMIAGDFMVFNPDASRHAMNRQKSVYVSTYFDSIVVYGAPHLSISSTHKKKVRKYIEDNYPAYTIDRVLFMTALPDTPWKRTCRKILSWDDVRDIKLNDPVGYDRGYTLKEIKGSYDLWQGGSVFKEVTDLDDTKPIVYLAPADKWWQTEVYTMFNAAKFIDQDAQFVKLGKNRFAKFKRDWPTAIEFSVFVRNAVDEWNARKFTDGQMISRSMDTSHRELLEKLDAGKIKDPLIRKYIGYTKEQFPHGYYNDIRYLAQRGHYGTVKDYTKDGVNPFAKYTLLTFGWYGDQQKKNPAHVTAYLNAAYPLVKKN